MITLSHIFSSGALFQQNSVTDFRGTAAPNTVITCTLKQGNTVIRSAEATSDKDGFFILPIRGEAASFEPYSFVFSDGKDELTLTDILFGELWLAAGQSNMEMTNQIMENREEFLELAKKHKIRFYRYDIGAMPDFQNGAYPREELSDLPGFWSPSSDKNAFLSASAAASAAMVVLSEFFEQNGQEIPVGFVDISLGGTPIEAWLPLPVIEEQKELKELLVQAHRYTAEEDWNVRPINGWNHHQQSALYNSIVGPVLGIKAKGVLWYQGESNVSDDRICEKLYKLALETYQKVYEERFSADSVQSFPLICSLLFPWIYGINGDVRMGYINLAMTAAAAENPGKIAVAPIHDLPAKWSYFFNYHPIHPTNKYGVGERLGNLMLSNAYGDSGLPTAAYYKRTVRKKGAIELHFETFRQSLSCRGERLNGFYICSKNGTYVPADAEIISRTAVRVSSEYISSPTAVCYQLADLENDGNLFCGELPVAPFATDTEHRLNVAIKPWLSPEVDSQFRRSGSLELDVFCYPVRYPTAGSTLCFDPAYRAIRIAGTAEKKTGGMYVKAEETMPLDLENYREMRFPVYARPEVGVSVKITLRKGEDRVEKICPANTSWEEASGIVECRVPFRIERGTVTEKIEFCLDFSKLSFPTAAIGEIALVPKKSKTV